MKEGQPRPENEYWRSDIIIWEHGDDKGDGVTFDLSQYAEDAFQDTYGKEMEADINRLRKLRTDAHEPACPCKSCKAANLRERRSITKKWRMPDDKC